jgi:Tol biopolymer transport system component
MYLPSGARIVFQSPRNYSAADEVDLFTMDSSGVRQRRLVIASGFDGVAVPSPDGRRVAFQRAMPRTSGEYHWELYVVDTLGGNDETRERLDIMPSWWANDGKSSSQSAGRDQLVLDVETGATRSARAVVMIPRLRCLLMVSGRLQPGDGA